MSDKYTQIHSTELSDNELDAVAGGNAIAQVTALSQAEGNLITVANVGTQTNALSNGLVNVGIATGFSVAIGTNIPGAPVIGG